MMREVVVDTNVALVANRRSEQASAACIDQCMAELDHIQKSGRVVLDQGGLILKEYAKKLHFSGQPGAGDRFFKWLRDHRMTRSRTVRITEHPERGFEEFPADSDLDDFDRDDRKFVAVALASGADPEILNATDTDWWNHRQPLRRHGVEIKFLCPELMPKQ